MGFNILTLNCARSKKKKEKKIRCRHPGIGVAAAGYQNVTSDPKLPHTLETDLL